MKRIFVISCILALASAVILAQNRTESNARQIASEFLSEIKGESVPLESAPARRMAPGVTSLDTPYYIVSDKNNESFVIVSGDERMTTILGYSLDKGYDSNNLPEGLRDLLSEYEKAYQYLKTNGVDGKTRRNVAPSDAISPLVQTEWGQDKPYNNLCPKVGNEHTLTGCVATATSQIMNYYQYPNRGTGSVSYKTETLGLDINCNLESYAFDWQNMKNHYGFYSDNQGKAVSELMYCLGVSVQMDYGIEESGTYPDRLLSVLVDNFGYQKQSLSLDFKDEYDLDSWTMMIDAELHASRPIIYNSNDVNYTFGHSYILDGKDSEGRYHINWGWDGHYNGYYSLNALEPYEGMNISTNHIMLRGIKPGKCKVTYLLDGVVYYSVYLAEGERIPQIAEPIKSGYKFSGWTGLPETMGANDIQVTGSFVPLANEDYDTANNILYIKDRLDSKVKRYHTCQLPLLLNNTEGVIGFQCDLVLPDGAFVESIEKGSRIKNDASFSMSFNKQTNGITRIVGYSGTNTPIGGNTGEIAIVSLNIGDSKSGLLNIEIQNQVISKSDYSSIQGGESTFKLNVDNNYRLAYYADGELYKSFDYYEGNIVNPIDGVAKEGYSFSGWRDVPSVMPANDIVVHGSFSINHYNLIYVVDDVIFHTESVVYNNPVPRLYRVPEKYDHKFSGWIDTIPETMPAHDVAIKGHFIPNIHLVTYLVDDTLYYQDSVANGSKIIPIDSPAAREGMTFSGWNNLPDDMMHDYDVVVSGFFTANTYSLTYFVDGENYSYTVKYGDPIVPLDDPTKIGYTFSGWGEIPETMPAHDVEIVATFSINSYTITYYVDGELYRVDTVQYQTEVTLEDAPQKVGHTFIVDKGKDFSFLMPAQDIEIEGHFNLNFHKLTYYLDGIECMTNMLPYGAHIDSIASEGYTVIYLSEVPQTMPDHDVDIYFTQVVNTYRITYELGEDVYYVDSVEYGSSVTPIDIPTKEGFDFVGWNNVPEIMPAEDVVAYGYFYPILYTLTFSVDGEYYYSDVYYFGDSITYLPTPEKYGYTFIGWQNLPETMPARSVSVDAIFAVNTYCIKYVVDGEIYQTDSCSFGEEITAIQYPTKEGHTFSGWSEIPERMPAHDVEITGSFSVNTYYLAYMVDSVCFDGFCVLYGETSIPVPADEPFKEGHTFSGWNGIPVTMPAHNVEVNGSFSVNTYTLTYMLDGEVYKTEQILYGDTIVPLEDPNKEGYTFSGWSEIPETMPAYDVEITGSFSVNKYTLTYMLDGEVYKTEQISYGETIVPAKAPTRSGYTFSGWSEIPETMPAHDVEISGSFKINVWNLIYRIDGEVYQSFEVNYGDTIVPLTDPAKEGYTFSGWSEIPETMPNHVVYVDGSFTINVYRVEISVNEGGHVEVSDTLPTYGSSIKISIIPDEGFEIASVVINNQDVTANVGAEGYHISDITSDINIVVTFSAIVGLDMMSVDSARNMTFDLSGRKVQNRMNGRVYIQNGKKMIMK